MDGRIISFIIFFIVAVCISGTVAAAHFSLDTNPTNKWISVYGLAAIGGDLAEPGDEIAALDPDGIVCGIYTVSLEGTYGFLHIYGDDSTTSGDEGAIEGDAITFVGFDLSEGTETELEQSVEFFWTGSRGILRVDLGDLDLEARVKRLEDENQMLKDNLTNLDESIDILNQTITGFVTMVKDVICYVFNAIGLQNPFWQCNAVACTIDIDCGEDACGAWGSNYCAGGDVYRSRTCHDRSCVSGECHDAVSTEEELVENCANGCNEGTCNQSAGNVIFRTNAVEGNYKYGSWVAYDIDGDGVLDGRSGRYKTTLSKPCPDCVLVDYFGRCMIINDGYPMVKIGETASNCEYRKYDTQYYGAETTKTPKEPYSSNHQEVYG